METVANSPAERAPLRFAFEAAPLVVSLTMLATVAPKPGHRTVDILSRVLIEASEGGEVTFAATDLDCAARFAFPLSVETPGALAVEARAFAAAVKQLAKTSRGAMVEAVETGSGLVLSSGRARLTIATSAAADYPAPFHAFKDREPAHVWTVDLADADARTDCQREGNQACEGAAKALTRFAKVAGPCEASALRVDPADGGDGACRVLLSVGTSLFSYSADVPGFSFGSYRQPRDPFQCDENRGERARVAEYLETLRVAHGLPMIEGGADLVTVRGLARGLTVGASYYDASESRDMPDGWAPPEGVEIVEHNGISGAVQCEIDGVEFYAWRGKGWAMRYVGTNRHCYQRGAYSIPMPRGEDSCVAVEFVEIEGETQRQPIRTRNGGAVEFTAAQIADMVGDVSALPRVTMPDLAYHHGRLIARDGVAVDGSGRRLVALPTAPKVLDGRKWRKMTDREQGEAYSRDPAAFIHSLQPVWLAALDDMTPFCAADHAPADQVSAAVAKPETVDCEAFDIPESEIVPTGSTFDSEPVAVPEPVADDAPAYAPAPEPIARAADPVDGLAERLARIEAALGLSPPEPIAKRSPAHAAAIRRAWGARCAMRERADLDRRALLQVNGYNRIMRETAERDREKIVRLEAAALDAIRQRDEARAALAAARIAPAERVELVAEIDFLRAKLDDMGRRNGDLRTAHDRHDAARYRIRTALPRLRRSVAHLRAERDGLAHNLAVMSRRAVADAATIEALRTSAGLVQDGQPVARFIMASR